MKSKENELLEDSYISNNTLNIRVTNIEEFNNLISEVQERHFELSESIRKLERFQLKINFSNSSAD